MGVAELVRVAGTRWAVEECFQAAKNETALDHYQVRLHVAWYRYITLDARAGLPHRHPRRLPRPPRHV